jgi:hypothetical protein
LQFYPAFLETIWQGRPGTIPLKHHMIA